MKKCRSGLYVHYGKSKSKNKDGWWLMRGGEPIALFKNEADLDDVITLQSEFIKTKTHAVKAIRKIITG